MLARYNSHIAPQHERECIIKWMNTMTDPRSDRPNANHISRREATAAIVGAAISTGAVSSLLAQSRDAETLDWKTLASKLEGQLTTSTAGDFEAVCHSLEWNGMKTTRQPDAIVRAQNVADVQHAVRFARENNLKVAVRGGGHSMCASSMRDAGILIDLGAFGELQIDANTKRAAAGPAVKGGELAAALAQHNMAFPIGHCPTVPLSGYILSGGFGWNTGTWGPACANLVALDVVDANGELIHADETQNEDYLWAARGAGPGFFGVAVKYHLKLHDMPKSIRTQMICFHFDDAHAVGQWMTSMMQHIRPETEFVSVFASAPPDVPDDVKNTMGRSIVVMITAYADSQEQADEWLRPFRRVPDETKSYVAPFADTPFEALLGMMNAAFPAGARYTSEMVWCDASPADVIMDIVASSARAPSRESFMLLAIPSPQSVNAKLPDMAMSMFSRLLVGVYGIWQDANADDAQRAWPHRAAWSVNKFKAGYYVGETYLAAADRPRNCFAPEQWNKLARLRIRHDPSNVFHSFLLPTER